MGAQWDFVFHSQDIQFAFDTVRVDIEVELHAAFMRQFFV